MRDFPQFNEESNAFDPKFHKEVELEMVRRVKTGRDSEDAELMYDSAATVYAKWSREGRIIPRRAAELEADEEDTRRGGFDLNGRSLQDSTIPNEAQARIGMSVGLSQERMKELREKYRKNR